MCVSLCYLSLALVKCPSLSCFPIHLLHDSMPPLFQPSSLALHCHLSTLPPPTHASPLLFFVRPSRPLLTQRRARNGRPQPLHFACFSGCAASVAALLSAGADVNAVDSDGVCPLHWAALQGHAEVVSQLLAAQAWPNFMDASDARSTPLDHAAGSGHDGIAAAIREHGGYLRSEMELVRWSLGG